MRIIASSILGLTLLVFGCATNGANQGGVYSSYVAPKVGTLLKYKSYAEGNPDNDVNQLVVATGSDYTLYANIADFDPDGPTQEDYFLEFSGLYWNVCGDLAPSIAERQALRSMWPITNEARTTLAGMDLSGKPIAIDVKVSNKREIESTLLGPLSVFDVRSSFETSETTSFSPTLSVATKVEWGDEGRDNYLGYDELVSVSQAYDGQYANYIAFGRSQCLPVSLK